MSDRARNSIRGRRAQHAGDTHEAWLAMQHGVARLLGILACIDKIDPPAVVRQGRVEFGPKTVSDYIGMLDGGSARYLAVEAKSTLKHYLPRSEVTDKQQGHLTTTARGGGLALLVVEFRYLITVDSLALPFFKTTFGPIRRYAIPWSVVPWATLKTAQSTSESDLLRGGWLIEGGCYLERFHPRGTPSTPVTSGRIYPKE